MSALQTFNFEGAVVRTVIGADGEPWFVAADVCAALTIGNSRDAVARLDDDEKGVGTTDTLGGEQRLTTVNESGLYSLVMGSRKPEAKRFKKWVTSEVLPSIRKTGGYGQPAALNDPTQLRSLLLGYTERVLELEGKVGEMAPKVAALDRIATSDGSFCLTDAAKALQVAPRMFFARLQQLGWIHRRPMGSGWLAYQERINQGVLEHKVTTGEKTAGGEWTSTQVRVTAKGMARLARHFETEATSA